LSALYQGEIKVKNLPLSMLVDRNCRESDHIVLPLDQWNDNDLQQLHRLVKAEIKDRKEGRPFWV